MQCCRDGVLPVLPGRCVVGVVVATKQCCQDGVLPGGHESRRRCGSAALGTGRQGCRAVARAARAAGPRPRARGARPHRSSCPPGPAGRSARTGARSRGALHRTGSCRRISGARRAPVTPAARSRVASRQAGRAAERVPGARACSGRRRAPCWRLARLLARTPGVAATRLDFTRWLVERAMSLRAGDCFLVPGFRDGRPKTGDAPASSF